MRETIWTYEKCKEEALKYNTRNTFKLGSSTAYKKCIKNKWYELLSHMNEVLKPKGYWTYEKCKELALSCKTKLDFIKYKGSAYNIALENGWLDDICSHFELLGNNKKRCIYAYEFSNKVVYVGLTYNFEARWVKRMKDENDIVKIYIDKTNEIPKRIKLTDYIDVYEASIKEGTILKEYINKGWSILNRAKTGSVGGNNRIWTYEKCKEEALKYETYKEFKENNYNCYAAIYKNNWQSELLSHLKHIKRLNGFWNEDECYKASKECNGRKDFYKKYRGAYAASIKNNWIEKFFPKDKK
jgi:hypothetical protein